MSETPPTPAKRGRRTKDVAVQPPGFPPMDGIPQDVLNDFTREKAIGLLHAAYYQCGYDGAMHRWMLEKMFGTGGWHQPFMEQTSPSAGPDALQAALDRARDAFVAGKIDVPCFGLIAMLLTARLDAMEAAR